MAAGGEVPTRRVFAAAIAAVLAASPSGVSVAQTPSAPTPDSKVRSSPPIKISAKLECSAPELTTLEVGDAPRHVLSIGKSSCRWIEPILFGRLKTRAGESKMMRDDHGNTATVRGYHVGKTTNGDAYYFRFDGQAHVRDGAPEGLMGRWAFTGGTGQLTGLKGEGRYKGVFDDHGVATIEMEGEYRLP